jgi:ribonuclease-3
MTIFFRRGIPSARAKELRKLERLLGIRFRKAALLHQALVHRSYAQASLRGAPVKDNETLEFLGDAVLGLVVSEELFRHHPISQVGDLAKIKAQVVSRATLAEIALSLGLDRWILLGPAETQRGEGQRASVIGSALEAVFAAVYLDRGPVPTAKLIRRLFQQKIRGVESGQLATDYKSLLQEYANRYFRAAPEYRLVGEAGPGHRRRFQVTVGWHGKTYGHGSGPNKKQASQEAARVALEHLLTPPLPRHAGAEGKD